VRDVVLRGGPPVHPWVYSKRVLSADPGAADGDVVRLRTREGRPCGYGFFHRRSLVAVRVLSLDPERAPDAAWLAERVDAAARLREEALRLPDATDAWRVVHGEADGLSGLVVDRYGPAAVASLFSLGWHRRFPEVERVLRERLGVEEVVARTDDRTAAQEGFRPAPSRSRPVEITERGVRYVVDPAGGHKTGFFLDQRDQRDLLARLCRGRRVFDATCYTGGFAIACAARGGAAEVSAMDLDEEAIAVARENARRNAVDVRFRHGDAFDALRALATGPPEARPDVLVVDPPKWARDRAGLRTALRKYADLNRLAVASVREGGLLLTCSCSGLVSEDDFLGTLRGVALDLRTDLRFLHVGGAAPDHPVSSSFPEGRYLKAVLLSPARAGEGPGRSQRPDREDEAAPAEGYDVRARRASRSP
jgi:23S rRNA (cytosine1962-C5)-methyltransferase